MRKFFSFMLFFVYATTYMMAGNVVGSTTLPENGRPEHVYTMKNANNLYVSKTTAPTQKESNYAKVAFYAVSGVSNAYHIYDYASKKWLSYNQATSYSNCQDFVKLVDSKASANYFKLDNYSGNNYQISPYTSTGSTDKYLNWYKGQDFNPLNGSNTLGLWQDSGSADNGSRWTFTEVVFSDRTYTVDVPDGITVTIGGKSYTDGQSVIVEGTLDKSQVTVNAPDGKYAFVSVDNATSTVSVSVVTLPEQGASQPYTNAWVYPKQQDNVGEASLEEVDGVYTLSNNVLAASFMKVGGAMYFAGSNAMNLAAGTELFTVAFGNGDNVPASSMTLKSVTTESLTGRSNAVGGAEHFDGKQIVANFEYTYNGAKVNIVWRAILRDGSHYLRTEMDLTGVGNVDMYNIIPLIYNVDAKAAGSTPKVVGNTRGSILVSDKIFAGLETPTAYNTVGGASGDSDPWVLAETKSPISLSSGSWQQMSSSEIPPRVTEFTGASYPNVYAYKMQNFTLTKGQKVEVTITYVSGNNRLNFGGVDLIDSSGGVAASDYHSGYTGNQHSNNTFTFTAPYNGTFTLRAFVEKMTEPITASSTMSIKIYNVKPGVTINTDLVGIQGLWSRNTTLASGETWKVGAVVGLVAQDGTQSNSNIHATQKRRSFLAYSERERAVPWRPFPHYNSWYELNIDRNNAADPTQNMNANQVLDVMQNWKTNFFDKYGEGIVAFVIDDGWDNYGTWTFHNGFPNEMRDMAALASQMNAGVGAWLGPVGGYGTSGNYRRNYWSSKGGMQLSNPAYYQVFKDAAYNLVKNQGDFKFFKFDGISAQASAVGPDAGDTGNENAEGIIRLERYVREELREDIFFNTTVGTWASPFWYQITDATWRQEGDYGEIGNNSIDREKWITYRDRLVYQNYVTNSPICPINTLMTHGFILTTRGAVSKNMDYNAVLRELRCAFVCGSGMVELYADYGLMNSINSGKLWADLAECVAWQKKNADVLADAHWVGGNPWTGSQQQVYGWASWNGSKATLALRNGSNSSQSYSFTLREALNIPANISGKIILKKSFNVQDALSGLSENTAIDIDQSLTVNLPASSVFAFDGIDPDNYVEPVAPGYSKVEVKSLSDLSNDKVYFIESARCFLANNSTSNASGLATSNGRQALTEDLANENQHFKILNEGGQYYLYSVGAQKYVNNVGAYTDSPVHALNLTTVSGSYPWKLSIGANYLNSQEKNMMDAGIILNDWSTTDAGNCYRISEILYTPEETDQFPKQITDVSQLSNNVMCTIKSKDAGRGNIYALSNKVDMCAVTYNQAQTCHSTAYNPEDPNQQFAFVKHDGKFYLYSVGQKKFVGKSGDVNHLTNAAPFDYITVTEEVAAAGEDYFSLFINDANYITASPGWCSNASRNTCLQTTLTSKDASQGWDDGAWFTITAVGEFDPSAALALLDPSATVGPTEAQVTALLAKADQALALDGVGCPVDDERTALESVKADLEGEANQANYDALAAALTNYVASTNVKMPESGKAYTFVNKQKNGTLYYLTYTSNGVVTTTEATEATPFVCKALENGKFMFVNNAGKYMIWRGNTAGLNSAKGYFDYYDTSVAGWCDIELTKVSEGSYIEANSEEKLFGCLYFKGRRQASGDGQFNYTVIKSDGGFDQSSVPYFNSNFSSAMMLVEAEYPNTPELKTADGIYGVATIATYSAPFATIVPEGVTAWYAHTESGNYVNMTAIEGAIPANTGVVLTGEDAGTVTMVPAAAEALATVSGNLLSAAAAAGDYTVGSENAYVIGKADGVVAFYPLSATNRTIAQGKSFLVLPANLGVVKMNFDGTTTGIGALEINGSNAPIFDLSGRRVVKAVKGGVYIQNGKKFIVK